MKTKTFKLTPYILKNRDKPKKSRFTKMLPIYNAAMKHRILVNSGTGSGKTETAMALAPYFREMGAKYQIILFPKISIGKNKESGSWAMIYDGKSGHTEQFLATYDNLAKIGLDILSNAVVWIDEVHELAASAFRPDLKPLFDTLFKYCPYIIGMSGTINPFVFEGYFDMMLIGEAPETDRQVVLHDDRCVKHIKDKKTGVVDPLRDRNWTELEYVEHRLKHTKATHLIIFIENKTVLHTGVKELLAEYGRTGKVYHSGESNKTIKSDDEANWIIKNGAFQEGVNALLSTSGAVAGFDLKLNAGESLEVLVASTHKNMSSIETLKQMVSRWRTDEDVHVYKMQASYESGYEKPAYNHEQVEDRYKARIKELKGMTPKQRGLLKDDKHFVNEIGKRTILGHFEYRQRAVDAAYSNFVAVPNERRVMYAQYMGFTSVISDLLEQTVEGVPYGEGDGSYEVIADLCAVLPLGFTEDKLRKFLGDDGTSMTGVKIFADEEAEEIYEVLESTADHGRLWSKAITARVMSVARLLGIIERESLVDFYEDGKNAKSLRTLTERWDYICDGAILEHKVRNKLLKAAGSKSYSAEEIASHLLSCKKDFSSTLACNKRCFVGKGKVPRIEHLLRGFCDYVVTRARVDKDTPALYRLIDKLPMYGLAIQRAAVTKLLRGLTPNPSKVSGKLITSGVTLGDDAIMKILDREPRKCAPVEAVASGMGCTKEVLTNYLMSGHTALNIQELEGADTQWVMG